MNAHPVEEIAEFEGYLLASLYGMEHSLGGINLYLSAFIGTLKLGLIFFRLKGEMDMHREVHNAQSLQSDVFLLLQKHFCYC